jgi:hypothetical protein
MPKRTGPQAKPLTPAQRRQRELAWLLFITEGYVANVAHALAVNAYTLEREALAKIKHAHETADKLVVQLRTALTREAA